MNLAAERPAAVAAAAGLTVLGLAPVRVMLEASMTLQMLVQFPLVIAAGWLLARALPHRARTCLAAWNAHGIAGLLAVALVLAMLMVPRVLDLALVDGRVEAAKGLVLVGCGAALQLSWRRAGLLVQGFFLGNVLPMSAAVGLLYEESPLRLCNAYLLDDQVNLGRGLVVVSMTVGLMWCTHLLRVLAGPRSNPLGGDVEPGKA